MKLSVVVPCYNEAANVSEFESELSKALLKEKITYEIIFIDDGSTDDTYSKLSSLNKANKNVKVIRFSRNFGKESAMLAGLKNASGSYVAIMDADLQHTPEMLILMYKKLINDYSFDCCCAYKSNREDEGSLKRTLTSLFYKIIIKYQTLNYYLEQVTLGCLKNQFVMLLHLLMKKQDF